MRSYHAVAQEIRKAAMKRLNPPIYPRSSAERIGVDAVVVLLQEEGGGGRGGGGGKEKKSRMGWTFLFLVLLVSFFSFVIVRRAIDVPIIGRRTLLTWSEFHHVNH